MNHTLKSITSFVFLVIIFFFVSASAMGQHPFSKETHNFSLSSNIGFLYGTSYEIVYKYPLEDEYLSELKWEIKPLFYMGINFNYEIKNPAESNGFIAGIGLKAALPMKTGTIEDRDWMEPCSVYGALTHFSSHDNHTKAAFLINLSTGYSIPVWKLILKFFLNIDYMYFSFEARNGYKQYGDNYHNASSVDYIPWNSSFDREYDDAKGLGISYRQHWFLFNTGVEAEFPLNRFTLSGGFFMGPSLCIAIDDHHKRELKFIDYLYQGFAIKPTASVFFSFSDNFDIGLSAAYHCIFETRGDTVQKGGDYPGLYMDVAGAAFKVFEGSVMVRYRFL